MCPSLRSGLSCLLILVATPAALAGERPHSLLGARLPFVEHRCQPNGARWFLAERGEFATFFTDDALIVQVAPRGASETAHGVNVFLRFVDVGQNVRPEGVRRRAGRVNVLRGNDRAQWERDLPVYDEVRYRDLYPGVGMTVHERGGALEYDVCLEPFADPQRLVMQVDGASRLRLDPDGALVIETDAGMIRQDRPLTYEITPSGERLLVDSSFRLLDSFRFGFEVRGRDPSRALVIDPQLAYSTYLGGTGDDQGMGIAVDAAGAIYVAGYTFSSDLPTSAGAFDRSFGGSIDAFVVKLHPAGGGASDLDYATFLGGSADDIATDIAVDGSGTAWIIGNTQSSGFPTTPGAYDPVLTDTQETFVTALTAAGDGLVYSTLFRGTEGSGIALFGDLYLSGRIYGPGLPVTPNAFDATFDGPTDGYLAQLHPAGQGASDLRYATYLGGSGHDGVAKLAVRDGQIYAAGLTTATNFPVTSTAFDTSANGDYDGFVARLNPAGGGASDLVYSTYLGGASYDHVAAIAVDASGSVYVTGRTDSSDFPTRSALDATGNGIDAFVAKLTLDPAGSGGEDLVSSTYFGGSARDWGTGIALTPVGTICLAGFTDSADFPVVNAYDPSFHGGFDAYLATFDPALSQLLSSTYFGGNGDDEALDLAVSGSGALCITGFTTSSDLPVTSGAFDGTPNGADDVLIARFVSAPAVDAVAPACGPVTGTMVVTITGSNFVGPACTVWFGGIAVAGVVVSSTEIQAPAPPQGEGCVDVTVCNADGECSTPLGNGFYYFGAPAVTSIAPAGGVIEGGTVVTITGANFVAPCTVQFGSGRYGSDCTVVASVCEVLDRGTCSLTGPTVLQVTSPPGIAYGCVDVIVDTGVGTPAVVQSGFCYLEPPRIDSVSPSSGSTCGGAQVVITGANFVAPCDVFFGDTKADAATVVDAGTIVAITPPRFDPGVVDVMVDTKVPPPAVLPDGFRYDRVRPQIDSLDPADGPYVGGTLVTISGTSFCDGAVVKFGPDEATSVVVISPQEIRAVTPMHFPTDCRLDYQVPVRVMNPDGSSGIKWGFTYHPSHILEVGRPGAGKPYTSIQAAIDAAGEGDAVVIDPAGEGFDFVESFDTKGKKIFVTSSDPGDRPVIAAATGKVLTITSGEGPQTVIACLALISGTGGILIDAGSSPTIIDNEIHDHITSGDGGGIVIKGGSSPLIQDNLIHTNLARHGGGIAVLGTGTAPTLVANEIRANQASGDGGGIYIETGSKIAHVQQCSIHENSAGRGGGIYCGPDPSANPASRQIRADDIFGNRCTTDGAGVFVAGGAKVEILESNIHDNIADGDGGGLACDGSQTTGTEVLLAASHIDRNQAQGPCGMGGGCFIKGSVTKPVTFACDRSTVCSNQSQVGAGLTLHTKVFATLTRNIVGFNEAFLFETDPDNPPLCPWQDPDDPNVTPDVIAPGIFEIDCEVKVINNTFYGNLGGSRPDHGGAFHGKTGMFGNSQLVDNIFAQDVAFELYLESTSSTFPIEYNDFFNHDEGSCGGLDCHSGAGNIYVDPLLVGPDAAACTGFELTIGSPCIDAGDPRIPPPQRGGKRVDIGAIEFLMGGPASRAKSLR